MAILSAEEIVKYGRRLAEDLSDLSDAAGYNAFLGERVAHPVSEDLYEDLMAELLDCHDKIKEHIEKFKTAYYERTKGSSNDVGDESPQSSEPTSPIYTPPSSPELPASPDYTPPSPQLPASPIYVPTSPNYTPPEQEDELPVISLDDDKEEEKEEEEEVQYLGSRKRRRLA